ARHRALDEEPAPLATTSLGDDDRHRAAAQVREPLYLERVALERSQPATHLSDHSLVTMSHRAGEAPATDTRRIQDDVVVQGGERTGRVIAVIRLDVPPPDLHVLRRLLATRP